MTFWTYMRETLSEDGRPSMKRFCLLVLLLLFTYVYLYNVFTGKRPDDTLQGELYYLLTTNLGLVLGSNIISAVKDIKITQSENNAKVNEPSPTPETTIITPKI